MPAVPYKDPGNYVHVSRAPRRGAGAHASRTARSGPISSTTSPTARRTTRPPGRRSGEQTDGTRRRLRLRRRHRRHAGRRGARTEGAQADVRIVLADPIGAALYHYYAHGELKAEGNSITEGIGQGRITANLEGAPIDDGVADYRRRGAADHLRSARARKGSCLGGSTGINVAGAIRVARELGPGHTDRHRAVRLRHALPEQAVQPGVPAREGTAGTAPAVVMAISTRRTSRHWSGAGRRTHCVDPRTISAEEMDMSTDPFATSCATRSRSSPWTTARSNALSPE